MCRGCLCRGSFALGHRGGGVLAVRFFRIQRRRIHQSHQGGREQVALLGGPKDL